MCLGLRLSLNARPPYRGVRLRAGALADGGAGSAKKRLRAAPWLLQPGGWRYLLVPGLGPGILLSGWTPHVGRDRCKHFLGSVFRSLGLGPSAPPSGRKNQGVFVSPLVLTDEPIGFCRYANDYPYRLGFPAQPPFISYFSEPKNAFFQPLFLSLKWPFFRAFLPFSLAKKRGLILAFFGSEKRRFLSSERRSFSPKKEHCFYRF